MICSTLASVSAMNVENNKDITVQKVGIKVVKNTPTDQIVKVNGNLITYHTDGKVATLKIMDKKTGKTINYKFITKKVKDNYLTEMYVDGKKYTTMKTVYNPIEKGMTLKKAMEINKKNKIISKEVDSNMIGKEIIPTNSKIVNNNIRPMSYTTTHYVWDGINYIEGRGIYYAHPDYDKPYPNSNYYIEPKDTAILHGNKLYHIHLSKAFSSDPPAVVGAAVAALVAYATDGSAAILYGAISGAVTDIIMNHGMPAIEDENDCIWYIWGVGFWYTYERIGPYVIEDVGGIGQPHP